MKYYVTLEEYESNLLLGLARDEVNLLQIISFCCDTSKSDSINNGKFKELIELKKQKSLEKEVVIKTLVKKYNTNNMEYYAFVDDFAQVIFYDK